MLLESVPSLAVVLGIPVSQNSCLCQGSQISSGRAVQEEIHGRIAIALLFLEFTQKISKRSNKRALTRGLKCPAKASANAHLLFLTLG